MISNCLPLIKMKLKKEGKKLPRDCLRWPLNSTLNLLKTVHVQCVHMTEASGVGHDVPQRNVSHAHAAGFRVCASPGEGVSGVCAPPAQIFTTGVLR